VKSLDELRPERLFDMTDRVVLVTGAAGGIGQRLVAGFAAAGAYVAMADVRNGALRVLESDMASPKCRSYPADITNSSSRIALVANVVHDFEKIDVLVNGSGINRRKPILETTEEDYDAITAVNQKAPFFLSKLVVKHMVDRHKTHPTEDKSIIHLGSVNSEYGIPEVGPYSMTKAALAQHVKVQAREWGKYGIRANCIAPGFIDTPLTQPLQSGSRYEWIVEHTSLGRFGEPDELVGPALLLASSAGSYITGSVLQVHGGFSVSDWTK